MSQDPFSQENPYQSPVSPMDAEIVAEIIADPAELHPDILRNFRQQIHALAGAWIFFGLVCFGVVLFFTRDARPNVMGGGILALVCVLLLGLGVMWIVLGVLAFKKQMTAVHVGLVMSYLSVAGNLLSFNLCGVMFLLVVILQAHRVLGWAKKMNQAGIPLTAEP